MTIMIRQLKRFGIVMAIISIMLTSMHVYAASHVIYNNGFNGIYIDIDSGYYKQYSNVATYGQYAYTTSGCAWFASARVRELTGKGTTIWAGSAWWKNYSSCGFTRGTTLDRSKIALACWANHVAVIEGFTSDGKIIVSEGGVSHLSHVTSANGYCHITTFSSEANLKKESSSTFYGYVYMKDIAAQPVELVFNEFNTNAAPSANLRIEEYNACIGRTINISGADISAVVEVGMTLYDNDTMAVVGSKTEKPISQNGAINVWYDMKAEVTGGNNLLSGHNYIGVFHAKLSSSYNNQVFRYNYPFKTIGIPVKYITLNPKSGTVLVNGTMSISAAVGDADASNKIVTWSSSNINIAAVDNNGNVRGMGPGTATIKCAATDGSGVYDTCTVTVNKLVSSITLNKNEIELRTGDSATLTATVLDSDASNRAIIWYSENTGVASVDSNGKVTANGPGTTSIVASAADGSGVYAECVITVYPPVDFFELEKHSVNMYNDGPGSRYELRYTIEPLNQANAIVWSSENTDIAEVTDNGTVIAKGAGRTWITAYIPGGFSDQCLISVSDDKDFLRLPINLERIEEEAFYETTAQRVHIMSGCSSIGEHAFAHSNSLRYVLIPVSVTDISSSAFEGDDNLCIICSKDSVAEEFAINNGIEYTLDEIAAYIEVRNILMPATLELDIEESVPLNAVIVPESASNKAIHWSSSNKDVAVVSSDGVVTGVSDGTAVIIAEPLGGYKSVTCTVTVKFPDVKVSADINTNEQEIGSKNAKLSANLTISGADVERVKNAGVVLYDKDKTVLVMQMNTPKISGGKIVVTADLKNDCSYSVSPATKYYYRYAVNVSGFVFYSDYLSFTTEEAPPEIVLSNETLTLRTGEEAMITAQVLYSEEQDIIWRSSNSSVAYVVDGRVVINGKGTTVITAMLANDTSVKATCMVTVIE